MGTNTMQIYWAFVITNEPLMNQPHYKLNELTKYSRLGLNTLIAPFSNKEDCQKNSLDLMRKYQLGGKILVITSGQFDLKTIVPLDQPEDQTKLNLNLEYTVTIYHESKKIIISFTKEQYNEIKKFNPKQ